MAYYVETNLIAITVALVLLFVERFSSYRHGTTQIIMNFMLITLVVCSLSDIAAFYFRGRSYLGVEVANLIYLVTMALGAYAWFMFIVVKLDYAKDLKSTLLKTGAPVVLLVVAMLLNPLTSFFFSVDDQLLYHRGPGIVVIWLVEWGYLLLALATNVKSVREEVSLIRRREKIGYMAFAVPIAVAAIAQMLVYGITTTQVGFMMALLMAYLNRQYYQIHRDGLTGLSNRGAFLSFQDSELGRQPGESITLFMMDMDGFKRINDTYGHLMGDNALRDAADVLKMASEVVSERLLLFRYGGDEFVAVGRNMPEGEMLLFRNALRHQLAKKNEENQQRGRKYTLAMSVGCATGECAEASDFNALLKQADAAMYAAKRSAREQA